MSAGNVRRTADGGPAICYQDAGQDAAPAVVLLHSLGADHRMWRAQVEALAGNYRVIAPDARGHGGSTGFGPSTVAGWVSDLDNVLNDAAVSEVVLAGVSMGGIQAVAYAGEHSDRVAGLVVADSFVELDEQVAKTKIANLAGQARRDGMAALADAYLAETFTTDPYPPVAEDVRAAIAGMSEQDYVCAVQACFGVRIAERLAQVSAPTLVVWGERDEKTPRALSERIAAGIAGAELAVLPDAGHLSNVENAEGFTGLVEEFITSRVAEGAR